MPQTRPVRRIPECWGKTLTRTVKITNTMRRDVTRAYTHRKLGITREPDRAETRARPGPEGARAWVVAR
jgi:hypothetical protein